MMVTGSFIDPQPCDATQSPNKAGFPGRLPIAEDPAANYTPDKLTDRSVRAFTALRKDVMAVSIPSPG